MSSLDFEVEKKIFTEFYDTHHKLLEDAKDSFITLVKALTSQTDDLSISKIDGRVKDKEESIKKFNLKYRKKLEADSEPYTIKEHITDLVGLRIVCLYEDNIERISDVLSKHFVVVDITNKIAQIENTEGSFGYKGLHLDLKLNDIRIDLPEYAIYSEFKFEVQIRTIIQDSWSVLDHKIKYKKSIPIRLKRRINTLAALFELADREFREIRDSTKEEMQKEEISEDVLSDESGLTQTTQKYNNILSVGLNAFNFLKIARHFFIGFEFEPYKVDGFTQEIISLKQDITRGDFNFYMKEAISKVKKYQAYFEKNNQNDKLNPYTIIRHCLYLGDKDVFSSILTNVSKESFDLWLKKNV